MAVTPKREYLACRYSVRGRTGLGLWDARSLCDFGPFSLHRGSRDGIRVNGLLDPAIAVMEARVGLGSWERFDARTNLVVRISAQGLGRLFGTGVTIES